MEPPRNRTMDVWVAFRGTSNEVEARAESGAKLVGMCHALSSCIEEIDMGEYI